MREFLTPLLLVLTSCMMSAQHVLPSPWTWRCDFSYSLLNGNCERELFNSTMEEATTLESCKLTCGENSVLWPAYAPNKRSATGKNTVNFHPDRVTFEVSRWHKVDEEIHGFLNETMKIFRHNLALLHPKFESNHSIWDSIDNTTDSTLEIIVRIDTPTLENLKLDTEMEKYELHFQTQGRLTTAVIAAPTYYGARHGIESLSQLIEFDPRNELLQTVEVGAIRDEPAYPYRGILLDTARNFIKVKAIEHTIDGMAANKLNTLHWHISDTQSFPMVLKTLPKMSYYGAYSPYHLYTAEDIKHIVRYGKVRGVRVVPELSAPGHAGSGWQWGPEEDLGDLVLCYDQELFHVRCSNPPCGQLNIANPNIYPILGKIYKEMIEMFGPLEMFHFGGNEVNLHCYNSTYQFKRFISNIEQDLSEESYCNQWSIFQNKSQQLLTEANNGREIPGILWTSQLTENDRAGKYLDNNKYIIQISTEKDNPVIKELLDNQFKVIFSNNDSWSLDCGFGSYLQDEDRWCSPYKDWKKFYDNMPSQIALEATNGTANMSLILGGEVALWTDQIGGESLDSRLWPRAAALAERLWTNPETNWEPAEFRMVHHAKRMAKRGFATGRIQPQWCHQHERECYVRRPNNFG